MVTKKYQIFVSSTFRDLVDERQDTIRNILDLNHIPAGMELFPAADLEQLEYIKKVIDECDYYLLIVGGRYGSMDDAGISYTEREYDYAVEIGKFVIAFVHREPEAIPVGKSEIKAKTLAALNAFRERVKSGRLVREWTDRQNLETAVIKSLSQAFNNFPQVGWIRGDSAANQEVLEQANKALQENATLRAELMMIKGLPTSKFENLADLDDNIEVQYRTMHNQYGSGKSTYVDRVASLKFHDIFLEVAAGLSTPHTDLLITSSVQRLLKVTGDRSSISSVNNMNIAAIKAQFMALGLIVGEIGTSVNGTVQEYLSLTPKGKSIYMDAIVLRKSQG